MEAFFLPKMHKYYIILILINFCLNAGTIQKIVLDGNNITKDEIILETLNHQIGDTISINLAQQDLQALMELNLFEDVIIHPADSIYYIIFFEKPKILYAPIVDNDDVLGWSAGLSTIFNNIDGKNKKLMLNMQLGNKTIFDFNYLMPKFKLQNDTLEVSLKNEFFENIEKDYSLNKFSFHMNYLLPLKNKHNKLGSKFELSNNELKYLYNDSYNKFQGLSATIFFRRNTLNNINKNLSGNIFNINYTLLLFSDFYPTLNKITIKNKLYIPFSNIKNTGRLVFTNQGIYYFSNDIGIFNKTYIATENYVRGYSIIPSDNPISIRNKLKWNNIITSSIQLEIPLYKNTESLFFFDYGLGTNNYLNWKLENKISSYGFGLRYEIKKLVGVDFCIGLNKFSHKEFHIIVNYKYY